MRHRSCETIARNCETMGRSHKTTTHNNETVSRNCETSEADCEMDAVNCEMAGATCKTHITNYETSAANCEMTGAHCQIPGTSPEIRNRKYHIGDAVSKTTSASNATSAVECKTTVLSVERRPLGPVWSPVYFAGLFPNVNPLICLYRWLLLPKAPLT